MERFTSKNFNRTKINYIRRELKSS